MSDQQQTGVITSLEEVFLSREFGRAPSRGISSIRLAHDVAAPPQLEQLFLADEFGHPEAVTAATAAVATAPPALVALPGRGGTERDSTRYRAIAAVSGVAAAALVVVGIASGTGQPARHPTVSAQGPGSKPTGPTGGLPQGTTSQPGSSGAGGGSPVAAIGGSGRGAPIAQLVSATSPSSRQVIVEVPAGTTVEVVTTTTTPPPPATGPGGTPPPPAPGGGSILTPLLVVVGNTVSTVGATVTATSDDLGSALPLASPLTGLLGNLGATVTSLGRSVVGTAT
jgi:hypothetical protein